MGSSSTSTPTPAGMAGPSTSAAPPRTFVRVGDTVLVRVEGSLQRPLIVAAVHPDGSVSGLIACVEGDHELEAFRGGAEGITGRPHRHLPLAYGECLYPGVQIGQWTTRPTNLPAGG